MVVPGRVGGALQLYFVRELLAAFALFAVVFAVFGVVIAGLYMLQKGWAVAVERVAESGNPVVAMARSGACPRWKTWLAA